MVYQQLAQLIRDAVWLKSYIAAGEQAVQVPGVAAEPAVSHPGCAYALLILCQRLLLRGVCYQLVMPACATLSCLALSLVTCLDLCSQVVLPVAVMRLEQEAFSSAYNSLGPQKGGMDVMVPVQGALPGPSELPSGPGPMPTAGRPLDGAPQQVQI